MNPYQALVAGLAVDIHGVRVDGVAVRCDRPGTTTRIASGGEFVLAGTAALVFPHLADTADGVVVELTGPGRPRRRLAVVIPAGSTFPIRLGDVVLPAEPVAVAGQVRRLDLSRGPIAGALVELVADPQVANQFPVALRTPLQAAHGSGGTVRLATVAPAGPATTCPAGARAGSRLLTVADRSGLAAGTVLRLAPGPREQYAEVHVVSAEPPQLSEPGAVLLRLPLQASVPAGSEAGPVTVTPGGPTRVLDRDAVPGDGLLMLDADLAGAAAVRLEDGTGAETYAVGALTDDAGCYRLAGVRAVSRVAVLASAQGLSSTQPATIWRVDERVSPNSVDLGVTP